MRTNSSARSAEDGHSRDKPNGLRRLWGRRQAFKLRPRQERLMAELLPRLALAAPFDAPFDPRTALNIGPDAPLHLEIGFGGGEHLAALGAAHPDHRFIGCEPFVNGMGKMLALIEDKGLTNIHLYTGDARRLIERLPEASLDAVYLLFPDPWPKTRHHKRRYVQDETLKDLARVLKAGGRLRIASDIPDYIRWTLAHMARRPEFVWLAERPQNWRERPADWPPTRYEQKALAAGRTPTYLTYRRRENGLTP